MNNDLPSMFIMLFVITTVFNIVLSAYNQPNVQGPGEIQNITLNSPNPTFNFLGPLLIVWDFVKNLLTFINAPWVFLSRLGAPGPIMTLFAVPWTAAWIFGIVSFIRGFKA